jgi:AcrR family transcriptional regulator
MTVDSRRAPAGAAVLRGDITQAIQDAVVEELAAVGFGRLSIEAVARRAGVAKTAVYRRWNSKLDLVLEMVSTAAGSAIPLIDTGSLRGDLELIAQIVDQALQHPLASQIIPDLLAEAARTPEIAETLEAVLRTHQRGIGEQVIGLARERGEVRGEIDADIVASLVIGPLYWRLAIARTQLSAVDLRRMALASAAALEALARDESTSAVSLS